MTDGRDTTRARVGGREPIPRLFACADVGDVRDETMGRRDAEGFLRPVGWGEILRRAFLAHSGARRRGAWAEGV